MKGKRVIVLGGSSGIGLATAQAAGKAGAQVVIVSGNRQRINEALQTLPAGSEGYAVDLGSEANIRAFFSSAGQFDHLVYTAGENISLSMLKDTDVEAARRYFNIRYWGAFSTIKYAAEHISAGGSINLTGGIASARPGAGWSLGASICAAMEGLTRAMAVELAPIRVNLVAPGVVKTNLWNSMTTAEREQLYDTVGRALPVKRVGNAEDIARSFLYLMQQDYCTGQVLTVDGGNILV